jgi:DNA-binding XRE family transcriptional regulator
VLLEITLVYLPSNLRDFHVELAGRLVIADAPGREVKSLRERYGFTQDALAPLLGMRRESLSRIESGHVNPSLSFVQRFTRIITLSKGVREHLAYVEARDNPVDEGFLGMLAVSLRLDKETADEVILTSELSYAAKRRQALRKLGSGGSRL